MSRTRTPRKRKAPTLGAAELDRGRTLLRLVEQSPNDEAALLVYTDWLEETGDVQRLAFLRAQQQLRAMKVSHPKLLERGRALHELGERLPRDWVDAVTYPKLADTAWVGVDDHGSLVWRFLPDRILNYTQPVGTYENGTWTQIGVTVAMETNQHYADYFGVIVGDTIRGTARNVVDLTWRWKVTWSKEPSVVAIPEYVSREVSRHHLPPKAAKQAKPKALPRKAPPERKAPSRRRAKISTRSR